MNDQGSASSVILLCSDLMLISSVGGLASSRQVAFRTVSSSSEAIIGIQDELADHRMVQLFIDLATTGLDLPALVAAIPETVVRNAVAYGPHVHAERLDAARAAGIGHVMSRGAFNARFPEFVGGL